MKEFICSALSTIGYLLIFLLGGWDIALQCLLIAISLDYVSGLIKAYSTKTLSSKIGIRGLLKKVGLLIVVMIGVIIDKVTGGTGAVRTLVIYYFVANEGLSIIENLGVAGVPIPKSIKKALKALKNTEELNG